MSLYHHMENIVANERERQGNDFDPMSYFWLMDGKSLSNLAREMHYIGSPPEISSEFWGVRILVCAPIPPAKHQIRLVREVEDFFNE